MGVYLHNPSVMPFLQYADKRDLREKIFKAYTNRGNNNNENDNKEVVKQLVTARLEKARLMGYEDYAAFVLEENMAKNEKNVYDLLDKIWPSALAKAKGNWPISTPRSRRKAVITRRGLGLALLFRESQESEI